MDVLNGTNTGLNLWTNGLTATTDYQERVAYDPNGNIQTYLRNGYGSTLAMDNLTYNYRAGTNKLTSISDPVASANYPNDIDNQTANNYTYDSIGNLLTDQQAGITANMTWSVYGKLLSISSKSLSYQYDASGNRIGKSVSGTNTWYVRDAQGNVLSTYNGATMALQEQDLYGSSRLGLISGATPLAGTSQFLDALGSGTIFTFTRGRKLFELSNHLGNVLATVSDKKFGTQVPGIPSQVLYYTADVKSAQDYYPFGMQEPGRSFTSSSTYRYGFNGQEADNEIKGQGNSYTALYWEYDTRSGRRWNIDPIKKPWQSDYATLSNSPIWKIDPNGDDDFFNSQGQLVKRTKTGSNIYIQSDKGNVLLTQLSLSNIHNRQAIANVIGYYANVVGITYQGAGSTANAGKGAVGLKASSGKSSDDIPAFTDVASKDIFINKRDNKINNNLFDYNNLENVLIHEKGHKTNAENKLSENLQTHVDVYLGAIKDETFKNGTGNFQSGIVGSFGNYLLNYYADFSNGSTEQLDRYVNDFNKNNKAGFFIQVDVSSQDEKNFKVNIYKNNKPAGSVNYKKIKNEGGDE